MGIGQERAKRRWASQNRGRARYARDSPTTEDENAEREHAQGRRQDYGVSKLDGSTVNNEITSPNEPPSNGLQNCEDKEGQLPFLC